MTPEYRRISILHLDQIRDVTREFFRVGIKGAFYRNEPVYRDAFGEHFIVIRR